jgi:DNA modification methylase
MKASERGERRVHPTQKPVALAAWCFAEFGKQGDIVIDLFLGSAPSLIAAEQMGRKLRGMELEPAYVDVAVLRWQRHTGKVAVLETGETFDEVAAARAKEAA